jgi:hypothetical protein
MPKLCIINECKKRAVYGITNNIHCTFHRLHNEINKSVKKCKTKNCDKIPNYGFEKGIGLFCKKHKTDNMIDVKSKKCIDENCNKISNYNLPDKKVGIYCKEHSKENMIDVKNKRCIEENCNIQPTYNYINKKAEYCVKHKKDNMIDVKSKRCLENDCDNYPTHNYKGKKSGLYCKKHSKENMISIRRRCIECDLSSSYNFLGNLPLYCKKHSKVGMIDVTNKKCLEENCEIRGNTKYKDYCFRCFIYKFPDVKISKNYKVKEIFMTNFIKEVFQDEVITFDKQIIGGSSKRRPDVYIDKFTHVIIGECDENKHSLYDNSDEDIRLTELLKDIGKKPVVFIRFNPDFYINENGKKIKSSFKLDKTTGNLIIRDQKEWASRLDVLKETINKHLITIPNKEITYEYLFYDNM